MNFIKATTSKILTTTLVVATILSVVLTPAAPVFAEAMNSGAYKIQADSINFAGGKPSSASFIEEDTAGEIATGDLAGTSYNVSAGYQQANAVASNPGNGGGNNGGSGSSGGGSSGNGATSPIIISGPINAINFYAWPQDKNIVLGWEYPEGASATSYRVVRSNVFFPSTITDGDIIYEGIDHQIVDTNVEPGTRYYYALFARNTAGVYSSGVLASARIPLPGESDEVTTPSDIFSDIPTASNTNPIIDALTISDFDFIQDGRILAQAKGSVAIDSVKNLTIRLDYKKVPEILKTIAVSLTDPQDPKKVFTFLLRANKDKTAYEATVAPLGRGGSFKLSAIIVDYKNQGLKRIDGNLRAFVLAAGENLIDVANGSRMLNYMIGLLVLAFIAFVAFVIHSRKMKSQAQNIITPLILMIAIVSATFGYFNNPQTAHAAFLQVINYQGKLADSSNVAVSNGSYNMRFKLYTTETGGSPIWTETICYSADNGTTCNGSGTDKRITVTNGLFSVLLGSSTSLSGVDFNQTLFLGVEIGGAGSSPSWDGEMSPRKTLGAVPAAFVAQNAITLNGLSSSQFFRSDAGSVTSGYFVATSTTASTLPYASSTAITVSGLTYLNGGFQALSSSTLQNFTAQGATTTSLFTNSASTTNLFATNGNFATLSTGSLNIAGLTSLGNLLVTGSTTLQNFTAINSTTTNATSTNLYVANAFNVLGLSVFQNGFLSLASSTLQNFTAQGATTTSLFTNSASTTNLFATNGNFATLSTGSLNIAGLTSLADLLVTGSTTLQNFTGINSTTTNATTTNFFVDNFRSSALTTNGAIPFVNGTNGALSQDSALSWNTGNQSVQVGTALYGSNFAHVVGSSAEFSIWKDAAPSKAVGITMSNDDLLLRTYNGSSWNPGLTVVNSTSYVGIGTTSPWRTLSVAGNSDLGMNALAGYFTATTSTASVFPYASTTALSISGLGFFNGGFLSLASSTLQNFTGINSTTTNATTTTLFASVASTTTFFANNATTTFLGITGNLTVQGTGTSTFNRGINLAGGCFAVGGTCLPPLPVGTAGQTLSYVGTTLTATSTITVSTNSTVGIGSTSPYATLSLNGISGQANPFFQIGTSTVARNPVFEVASTSITNIYGRAIQPAHKGSITHGGSTLLDTPRGLFVSGNYAYIVSSVSSALEIVDISNPGNPIHKSSLTNGTGGALLSGPYDVFVSGNYAYVVSVGSDALEIIDISNPAIPVHKGSISNGSGGALMSDPISVYVSGNYAYIVSNTSNNLEIVDISNPAAPTHKGSIAHGTGGALLSGPLSVFVSGNYAYIAAQSSNALEIVDISNPGAPVHKGSIANGSGGALLSSPQGVFVSGNYAYVAVGSSRALEIIDITNPNAPVHAGSYTGGIGGTNFVPRSVFVAGNYAYIASDSSAAIQIVDISDPTRTQGVGTISNGSGGAVLSVPYDIFVSGNYAYVISNTGNALEVIDISGATISNAQIGSAKIDSLQVMNFAQFNQGLSVSSGLNVNSNALIGGSLSVGGSTATSSSALASSTLSVFGDFGIGTSTPFARFSLTSEAGNSKALFNISTTTAAGSAQTAFFIDKNGKVGIGTTTPAQQLSVQGNGLFAGNIQSNSFTANSGTTTSFFTNAASSTNYFGTAASIGALTISNSGNVGIGSSTPYASLSLSGILGQSNPLFQVSTSSSSVLPAFEIASSSITNINGKAFAPTHKGSLSASGTVLLSGARSVFVQGNYAYVTGNNSSGLEIVDISNPGAPAHKGAVGTGSAGAPLNNPWGVYVQGNYAYVASQGSNALDIVDISNPASPVVRGSIGSSTNSSGAALAAPRPVYVSGNYAYIGSITSRALEIVDISDPANPRHKGKLTNGIGGALLDGPRGIHVVGNYAYIAVSSSNALEIVDVSAPANPFHKGSIADGSGGAQLGFPTSVFVQGNYAYVTSQSSNALEIVDISNPGAPVHKGAIANGATGGVMLQSPQSVFVSGNYAYVVSQTSNAFEVFDVSNPANPVRRAVLTNSQGGAVMSGPTDVFISGNYAYVAANTSNALEIIDISGVNISNAQIGSAKIDTLQVMNFAQFDKDLLIKSALNVGANALVNGSLAVGGTSSSTTSVASSTLVVNGDLGIGTSTPFARFSMLSEAGNQKALFNISTTTAGYATSTAFFIDKNGKVGIGTTTPAQQLSVQGNALLAGNLVVNGAASSTFTNGINLSTGCFSVNGTCIGGGSSLPTGTAGQTLSYVGSTLTATSTITVSTNSTVGIGSTSPFATLSLAAVAGQANPIFQITATSTNFTSTTTSPIAFEVASTSITNIYGKVIAPTHKGSLSNGTAGALLANATAVHVQGNYAYVSAQSSNALEVIDISNPANPVHKSSLIDGVGGAALNTPVHVFVQGNYAYVSSFVSNALEIIDISNPASTTHKGKIVNGQGGAALSSPQATYVSGNYAYTISNGGTFQVIDVSDPANPRARGSLSNGGSVLLSSPISVFVQGNYAYVASSASSALEIIDITDPSNPQHKGSLSNGSGGALLGGVRGVFVQGIYAYLASATSNALEIVDVSDPARPVHKGAIVNGQGGAALNVPRSVFVSGNYAYVVTSTGSALAVIDVSDPANPRHAGKILDGNGGAVLFGANNVFVQGNYAYIAVNSSSALEIIDISGTNISNAEIGSAKINTLQVMNYAQFDQGVNIRSALSVGSNALIGGSLSIGGNASSTLSTASSTLSILGDFGIGTSTPFARFSMISEAGNSKALFNISTTTAAGATSTAFFIDKNGKVGIGTTTPSQQLSVQGNGIFAGNLMVNGAATSTHTNGIDLSTGCFSVQGTCLVNSTGGVVPSGTAGQTLSYVGTTLTATSTIFIGTNGKVGIGTSTNPTANLQIYGGNNQADPLLAIIASSTTYRHTSNAGFQVSSTSVAMLDGTVFMPRNKGLLAITSIQDVYVQGDYAYVAGGGNNAMYVVALNPYPTLKATFTGTAAGAAMTSNNDVFVQGSYAYATGNDGTRGGLSIIDVSNPAAPRYIGKVLNGQGGAIFDTVPSAVHVQGNYAYIANSGSLEIVDISNPYAPYHKGNLTVGSGIADVFVQGDFAYLASTATNAMHIIDVSNPDKPYQRGTSSGGQTANIQNVFVQGQYAYITSYNTSCLQVYDISNPASPTTMGALCDGTGGAVMTGGIAPVYVSGKYAYVGSQLGSAINIIDVSDPTSLKFAGKILNGDGGAGLSLPLGLFVANNRLYVASGSGLAAIDIGGTEIGNATIASAKIGTFNTTGSATIGQQLSILGSLNVGGNALFREGLSISGASTTATGGAALKVNVSDPNNTGITSIAEFFHTMSTSTKNFPAAGIGAAVTFGVQTGTSTVGTVPTLASTSQLASLITTLSTTTYGSAFTISNAYNGSLTEYFRLTETGSLGLGTSTPTAVLTVQQKTSALTDLINIASTSGSSLLNMNYLGQVGLGTTTLSSTTLSIQGLGGGDLLSISSSTGTRLFRFAANGDAFALGAWTNGGADVAEEFPTDDMTLEPGDLVSIAADTSTGLVSKTTTAYEGRMIGIISTAPGVRLGMSIEGGQAGTRPVALNGRVPVKVNLENGPIEKGDYLTSSSVAGVAMKATDAGKVVAQALESYNGTAESNLILAFVNPIDYSGQGGFFSTTGNKLAKWTGSVNAALAVQGIYTAPDSHVGIGTTTTSAAQLTVQTTTATSSALILIGAPGQSVPIFGVKNDVGNDLLTVDALGNIGIGTTTTDAKLTVDGDISANLIKAKGAGENSFFGSLSVGGIFTVSTSTIRNLVSNQVQSAAFSVNSASSSLVNVNYVSADDVSYMDAVRALKPATYNYASESSYADLHLGIVVEDAPLSILSNDRQGIDLYKFTTLLSLAVQDNDKRITALEQKLASSTLIALNTGDVTASILDALASTTVQDALFNSPSFSLKLSKMVSDAINSTKNWVVDSVTGVLAIFTNIESSNVTSGAVTANAISATSTLTVGTQSTPSGITLYDAATGAPYCLKIMNGQTSTTAGVCQNMVNPPQQFVPPPQPIIIVTPPTETVTPPVTTPTTTPEVVPPTETPVVPTPEVTPPAPESTPTPTPEVSAPEVTSSEPSPAPAPEASAPAPESAPTTTE